ncbi:hypothetical protein P152DRAFT_453446 [Eremomyces bilateralis CBS 781.70]|uniref:Mitochondrial F1F0 ATP synthase subunit F n=1 Tax=Eremomyces bilateralis CBS 781.70 TaxID=1392243 RepID=A0A6G1GFM0_9PEZI|nr:uncharacterized protein P152DRAFT_453446 [Eremomyces bilateralis CBS 781.70]KAF1816824.1 hypothetical protein P152DRAFT_453446 [Eremomyces bilateralis CBS 781.70]
MSFIVRRSLSTLIPPKIASPNAIGAAQDAARMTRVVSFYEKLPRGPAPELAKKNPFTSPMQWYSQKHFGKNSSGWPLIHAIAALSLLGYAQNYYFHLRHHKNNAH